ncbi:toprim domain-containing protein [Pseudonocardia sp. N23]|uniref:toprim domain-containing protein n=1 Tax=Pseudonocardia sp. N23 TaxID=1987376 RepID=UPI000BFB17DD|nr:toprim domain-containing protein [Pseudonocardia sp. N23]GAY07501.1 phage-associated DNA primase [Pseudonocardia sp. N23]
MGLVVDPAPEHEYMRGRLSIPSLVPRGGPMSCKFRCLRRHDCKTADCPKYLGAEGAGAHPYNVLALRADSPVIGITEGELDAVIATEAGIPSVAIPGVKAWRSHYAYMLEGFARVLVFGDADGAGKQFAERLVEDIHGSRAIHFPDGHDVSSFVAEHGADALRERCS